MGIGNGAGQGAERAMRFPNEPPVYSDFYDVAESESAFGVTDQVPRYRNTASHGKPELHIVPPAPIEPESEADKLPDPTLAPIHQRAEQLLLLLLRSPSLTFEYSGFEDWKNVEELGIETQHYVDKLRKMLIDMRVIEAIPARSGQHGRVSLQVEQFGRLENHPKAQFMTHRVIAAAASRQNMNGQVRTYPDNGN